MLDPLEGGLNDGTLGVATGIAVRFFLERFCVADLRDNLEKVSLDEVNGSRLSIELQSSLSESE